MKLSAKVAEEAASASTKKIYSYFLDASQSYFVHKPKMKLGRKQRRSTARRSKVAPITSKFPRLAKKTSTSKAPAIATRKIPSQRILADFFPRDRFTDHPG